MYFSVKQVETSFKRLRPRTNGGKASMERTSSLMYFLSFDALCKKCNQSTLDFDPDTLVGKLNRKHIELEFEKLVLLESRKDSCIQVKDLGKIDVAKDRPAKRMSSNFLTVPLKKASQSLIHCEYPNRPSTPLLSMGLIATNLKWGVSHHKDWATHLPSILSQVKGSTPFTDLGVFVLRDLEIHEANKGYLDSLRYGLSNKFSTTLAEFWLNRVAMEKILVNHLLEPFVSNHAPFGQSRDNNSQATFDTWSHYELIEYIGKLEKLMDSRHIEYKSLRKGK